jgi:adenine-specific DNA-methyltransferase
MGGKSLDVTEEKLKQLKEILPEAFTESKIDWEKLKAALGEDVEFRNERYVLNWAGKSDAFRVLQSPTTATLVPCKDGSVNFDETENVFIEGENLEVLKVLQKSYFGTIKMIYIDPPYNTGNDNFIYPDKFSETKDEYLGRIGDKDETGYMTREGLFRKNSKDSGHYHSNWLSMMYPRLFLARNLLRADGVIFVSIDDNEAHNLRLLMNDVFGEENFVGQVVWKNKYGAGAKTKGFIEVHEYILCYSKQEIIDIASKLSDGQIQEYDKNKDEKYGFRGGFVTQPLMTNSLGDRENLQYTIEYKGELIEPRKQWVWEKKRLLNAIRDNQVVIKEKEKRWHI